MKTLGPKELDNYLKLTSGDKEQMKEFLANFNNGEWYKVYKATMSEGMIDVLTKLLARDPKVRGNIHDLLFNHPWLSKTPDITEVQHAKLY